MKPTNEMKTEGWKDSTQAFDQAVRAGRLSLNPDDDNYAGDYMYMGPGKGGDAFKHIVTRRYIA